MIWWLFRRRYPEPITCEKCGFLIGYDMPARGSKPAEQYRVEHERICLAASPDTPMVEPRSEEEAQRESTPEEDAEFSRLVALKQKALIQAITLHLNRTPENEDETMAMFEMIKPALIHPIMGMGPAATNRAFLEIITHLAYRLAEARGEAVEAMWQREAAELARKDGHDA